MNIFSSLHNLAFVSIDNEPLTTLPAKQVGSGFGHFHFSEHEKLQSSQQAKEKLPLAAFSDAWQSKMPEGLAQQAIPAYKNS